MKEKLTNTIVVGTLLTLTLFILFNSSDVIESSVLAISIWKDKIFPTLFPMFVISNLLICYNFPLFMGELLKNITARHFSLPGSSSFILVISMIAGFPSSSKYIRELLINNQISLDDANYLIKFTHFSNPLFIIGTIGSLLLQNEKFGILILISHYLGNFFIALLFRKKKKIKKEKVSLNKAFSIIGSNKSIGENIKLAIYDAISTLTLLLGIITSFLIINNIILDFNIPLILKNISSCILEMTGGVIFAANLNVPIIFRMILMTAIISFGGLSVHMQVLSIISDTKIKYNDFLYARILHVIISSIIVFLLSYIFKIF